MGWCWHKEIRTKVAEQRGVWKHPHFYGELVLHKRGKTALAGKGQSSSRKAAGTTGQPHAA